ncbi:hypothetical protein D3C71_1774480 [compost metagenome]
MHGNDVSTWVFDIDASIAIVHDDRIPTPCGECLCLISAVAARSAFAMENTSHHNRPGNIPFFKGNDYLVSYFRNKDKTSVFTHLVRTSRIRSNHP